VICYTSQISMFPISVLKIFVLYSTGHGIL